MLLFVLSRPGWSFALGSGTAAIVKDFEIVYAPIEEIEGNGGMPLPQQRMTVFIPPNPTGGLLIYVWTGGYGDLEPLDVIDAGASPSRRWVVDLYEAGWVIVTPGLTGSVAGQTQGMFSDYGSERFRSFTGESWWERDMVFVVKKVHQMIADGQLPAYHHLVGGHGVSASAVALLDIALGPVETFWAAGSPQLLRPTLLNFVVAGGAITWWPAYRGNEWALGFHFEGQTTGLPAPPPSPFGLNLVPPRNLEAASPAKRLQDRLLVEAGPPPPVYVYAIECPSVEPNGTFDARGLPSLVDAIRGRGPLSCPSALPLSPAPATSGRPFVRVTGGPPPNGQLHDYWFSWILKRQYDLSWPEEWRHFSRLATLPGFAYPPPDDDEDLVFTSVASAEFQDDVRDWVLRRMTGAPNPC